METFILVFAQDDSLEFHGVFDTTEDALDAAEQLAADDDDEPLKLSPAARDVEVGIMECGPDASREYAVLFQDDEPTGYYVLEF